jgi:hypothetical protein
VVNCRRGWRDYGAIIDTMAEDLPLLDSMPKRPQSDARIERYRVMPWPDGSRVTVEMTFGAFREFPSIEVSLVNALGDVVRATSLISSMERQPAPTMWLPTGLQRGTPMLALIEVLGEEQPVQSIRVPFEVAGPIIKQAVGE